LRSDILEPGGLIRSKLAGLSVSYITDDEIDGLPEDPEEAFVALERIARGRFEDGVQENYNEYPELARWYMSVVLPAARQYGIDSLRGFRRPDDEAEGQGALRDFMGEVSHAVTELQLRIATRTRQYSVAFDQATKIKLRHLLGKIRETVDGLNVTSAKREALYRRINALQGEIDRERTRVEALAALAIEVSDAAEPFVQQIERLTQAFGLSKRSEDEQRRLPAPKESKRISPPKAMRQTLEDALDEEIPF
jgi:hypothetical protein